MKSNSIILLSVLAGLALAGTVYTLTKPDSAPQSSQELSAGIQLGGPFTLQSANGSVSLSDFDNKLILIFFGFTSCPDVCPASLMTTAASLKRLDPEQRARIQPLFITVDPERDTADYLAEYVTFFDEQFIGLTGALNEIESITRQYGAFFRKVMLDSALEYTMDHSAQTYLVNSRGEVLALVHHSHDPEPLANTLISLLNSSRL
ncbi:SCO family protein [Nitrincola alkalilacustris]|uniref:SCO family protein n=1 Tax=Nitrincola alkalilacustris TaxID=1571224 RepID=UPI00124E29D2|nr:SCO family protein [Nitrincola alkalilacustris]